MERNPLKLGEQVLHTAANVGRFVLDRLVGGAWGELADTMEVPVKAQVHHYKTGE